MFKTKIFFFLIFAFTSTVFCQNWVPKYSVHGDLDLPIHGYSDNNHYNPWAIADTLMNPTKYTNPSLGMDIDGCVQHPNYLIIETNGATIQINKSDSVNQIIVSQKIGQERQLFTMTLLDENNSVFSQINPNMNYSYSEGRVYFKDPGSIEFRVNGDGLIMIKPLNSNIKKVRYDFNFYPGYSAKSPRIKRNDATPDLNKSDVSHLFMDEYGGFGVYLLDNEKELYSIDTSGVSFPSATYSITTNQIFWTAVFPPKQFNYNSPDSKCASIRTNWHSYVEKYYTPNSSVKPFERLREIGPWTSNYPSPMDTYWMVSDSSSSTSEALSNYIDILKPQAPKLDSGSTFIHVGDVNLWKNWQYEYVPRKKLDDIDEFSLLKKIAENVHSQRMKYIVYTSPQYFLNGATHYSGPNPFSSHNIDELDGRNDPDYNTIMANINEFTFNGGATYNLFGLTGVRIPILNSWDMIACDPDMGGPALVDQLHRLTGYPVNQFTPANREGENMWAYINAIKTLSLNMRQSSSSLLDGIYMDTFYELNIPRTYQLMRELRKEFGDGFVIYRHASGKEGQDAYLPQIDSYANFVMTGEGNNNNNYYDRKFFRYFVSTINISNSVAVLDNPDIAYNNVEFFNWLIDYNVRLRYPTLKSSGNLDPRTDSLFKMVQDFYSIFPDNTDALKARVDTNLAFHQRRHKDENLSYLKNVWCGTISNPSANDLIFKGDVDGNGSEEVIINSGGKWRILSQNSFINNTSFDYGNSSQEFLVGDFNHDKRTDFLAMGSHNADSNYVSILYSLSNYRKIAVKDSFHQVIPKTDATLLTGDFNGDNNDDILSYNTGTGKWRVYLCYGHDGGFKNDARFPDFSWPNSANGVPLVGDFNGDGKDDIASVKNVGVTKRWSVAISNGNSFTSPDLNYTFGEPEMEDLLIGNFDGAFADDIMIHDGNTWPLKLSKWNSPTFGFCNPNPIPSIVYGLPDGNDRPFVLDFNGDGYDDLGIYRKENLMTANIYISYMIPGTIKSSYSNELPKRSQETEIPLAYQLEQNYPNPFNPSTTIRYSIPTDQKVLIEVFNILGQKVATLVNDFKYAGNYQIDFNAGHLASGLYIYRINTTSYTETKKMLLLK